jgi:phospholipid/cholesterol/gamma-HCH transport system ATP-binding protein
MNEQQPLVVRLRGLHKSFGDHVVLSGLDLEVRRGESLVVLGGSGTGKSVLLKHINGLLRPDRGEVIVLGCDVTTLDERDMIALRRKVSYIFQAGALFDSLSVGENIGYPLLLEGRSSPAEMTDRVAVLLELVGLAGSETMTPAELSGGMRKRVALARGLALAPEVILYDEPTAGLDPLIGVSITRLIRDITGAIGATSLVVTHDLAVARDLADRVVYLQDGSFGFVGSFREAARDPGAVGTFIRAGGINV